MNDHPYREPGKPTKTKPKAAGKIVKWDPKHAPAPSQWLAVIVPLLVACVGVGLGEFALWLNDYHQEKTALTSTSHAVTTVAHPSIFALGIDVSTSPTFNTSAGSNVVSGYACALVVPVRADDQGITANRVVEWSYEIDGQWTGHNAWFGAQGIAGVAITSARPNDTASVCVRGAVLVDAFAGISAGDVVVIESNTSDGRVTTPASKNCAIDYVVVGRAREKTSQSVLNKVLVDVETSPYHYNSRF